MRGDELDLDSEVRRIREQEADNSPLAALDRVIDLFGLTTRSRNAEETDCLFQALCEFLVTAMGAGQVPGDDPTDLVFNERLPHEDRQLVGAALLRVLAADPYGLDQVSNQFAGKTEDLFDQIWASVAYQRYGLSTRSPKHEKFARLPAAVRAIESEWAQSLASFRNINRLSSLRSDALRTVNDKYGQRIIQPFLPADAPRLINEFFATCVSYAEVRGPLSAEAYEQVVTAAADIERLVKRKPTKYAQVYLGDLVTQTLAIIQSHYGTSVLNRPADITIALTDKRYPLQEAGREFEFQIEITNHGPGTAYDVTVTVQVGEVELLVSTAIAGEVSPGKVTVPFRARVASAASAAGLLATVAWANPDGSAREAEVELSLTAQRPDVDWQALTAAAPYDLEPVVTESELVGRRDHLELLLALLRAPDLGNAYLFGQRRVGKTSIVKTVASIFRSQSPDHVDLYVECGEYLSSDALLTVRDLGTTICESLRGLDSRLDHLTVPTFEGGLAPLNRFLANVNRAWPKLRLLLILDEFDGLPVELYSAGPLGDAVFKSLRSIGGKDFVSVMLVGGENMRYVWDAQGQELNKFQAVRVDYFDRLARLGDFQELVRVPVRPWLDVSDEAIAHLAKETAGNPYFAKLIARKVLEQANARRDSHVARADMEAAISASISDAGSPAFAHFWKDGILASSEAKRNETEMGRRRFLLGLADQLRREGSPSRESVVEEARRFGLDSAAGEALCQEFVRRGVLVEADGTMDCEVPFFGRWLRDRGLTEILDSVPDEMLAGRRRQEEAFVRDGELEEIVKHWGPYRGRLIGVSDVRKWLEQFGRYEFQRLTLPLLRHLRFYGQDSVRRLLGRAHSEVQSRLRDAGREYVTVGRQRKRSDILVSYLDGPGRSGARFAGIYADENDIYRENVIDRSTLRGALGDRAEVEAVVFVDDCIGSGQQASEAFRKLIAECGDVVTEKGIMFFFIPIVAFDGGAHKLRRALARMDVRVDFIPCELLSDADRSFSPDSEIYAAADTRDRAHQLMLQFGQQLDRRHPLGYEDGQAAVVFSEGCPNCSLPVLWKVSHKWEPLFPRLGLGEE